MKRTIAVSQQRVLVSLGLSSTSLLQTIVIQNSNPRVNELSASIETLTFPLAIPAFLDLHVTTTGTCVSVRDQDVLPTDNPPSTYLRRAPLTHRTPWHDRCSAGGVGIRGWSRAEGTRDSTSVTAEVAAATVVVAAAVNDEKKRATTFLSGPDTFTRKLRHRHRRHCRFHDILRIPSKSINRLSETTIFVDRRRAFAEYRITLKSHDLSLVYIIV